MSKCTCSKDESLPFIWIVLTKIKKKQGLQVHKESNLFSTPWKLSKTVKYFKLQYCLIIHWCLKNFYYKLKRVNPSLYSTLFNVITSEWLIKKNNLLAVSIHNKVIWDNILVVFEVNYVSFANWVTCNFLLCINRSQS